MHPYRNAPDRAFWSRAVSRSFDATTLVGDPSALVRPGEKVMTAGSCFAANLVPYLEREGFEHLRTEYAHPLYRRVAPENLSYGKFSAGYGNIYTARQLLQLFQRCTGAFRPLEDRLYADGAVIDLFRPGLRYAARSDPEFNRLTAQHLKATLAAFRACDVFIFTLGLTEAWMSKADGAVYPACPGTIAGEFDPDRHAFHNFTAGEITDDLCAFVSGLRTINPSVRIILTVSPVPLVATATDDHVLLATVYSKSVLRVAAGEVAQTFADVTYFPAYEIISGPQAPNSYYEDDRREPSAEGIECVMRAFFAACSLPTERPIPSPQTTGAQDGQALSRLLSAYECEEAAVEQ